MARVMKLASIMVVLLLNGCDGGRARVSPVVESGQGGAVAARPSPAPAASASTPRTIDRDPVPTRTAVIVSSKDFTVEGTPGCAFEIRYVGAIDQPAIWKGEGCGSVHARFVTGAALRTLGRFATLTDEARDDIEQAGNTVFYVEGQFASAIYPINEAQRVYKVSLAD